MEKNETEYVNRAEILKSFLDMEIVTPEILIYGMVNNMEEQLLKCVFSDELVKKNGRLFKVLGDHPRFWKNQTGLPSYAAGPREIVFERGGQLNVTKVIAEYDQGDISFWVEYLVRVKTSYLERSGIYGATLNSIVDYIDIPKWFCKRVPLEIISCWLDSRLERKTTGVSIRSTGNNELIYEGYPEAYPVGLYRWISSWKGDGFLKVLLRNEMISPESYRILRKKLYEIAAPTSNQVHDSTAFSDEPAAEIDAEDSEDMDANSVIDALSLSEKEKERLNDIRKLKARPLTYSKWAKYLGFKRKGSTFAFIQKEKQKGLLSLIQHGDSGISLHLTNKALAALKSL